MSQEYNLRKHYVNLACAYYVMFIISSLCILIEKVHKITQDSTRKKNNKISVSDSSFFKFKYKFWKNIFKYQSIQN